MSERHCVNATTNTAASADGSEQPSDGISFDRALVWRTQRAMFVLWPGEEIHAMCLGMGPSSTPHHHYATQLGISLGAPFQVRTRAHGPYVEQHSFIVGPNSEHQVETTGMPSFVLWSEARAFADLAHHLGVGATNSSGLPALPTNLLNALRPVLAPVLLAPVLLASEGQAPEEHAGQPDQALIAHITHILTTLIGPTRNATADDPRIATARSLVTPQFLAERPEPITSLATAVYLSPSRFRHLFRRQMGMSVQSYLRWKRLLAAGYSSASGASLTEAAHRAGFADSAHLTRVFHATFGMPPSHIFKHSHAVQVIPGIGSYGR